MAYQEKKRRRGYVYVLSNPSMPGIVKIGRTFRDPRARAAELSGATGVPTPFRVEATVSTWNCVWLEKLVHLQLGRRRVNRNREFFKCTLEEALKATEAASKKMKGNRYRRSGGGLKWIVIAAAAGAAVMWFDVRDVEYWVRYVMTFVG
jgi:hypothetical protein